MTTKTITGVTLHSSPTDMFSCVPAPWCQIAEAMLEDCPDHLVPKEGRGDFARIKEAYHSCLRELLARNRLNEISVHRDFHINHDEITPDSELWYVWQDNLEGMADTDLHFWCAVSAEIVDFSMLGRNVRSWVIPFYHALCSALETRGLEGMFLCDFRLDPEDH